MKRCKNTHFLLCLLLLSIVLTACTDAPTKYVIGVSQCSEDSWRAKLIDELQMATYFNEGVEVRFASANDNNEQQCHQIDSLVQSGIDLLIVSPNQVNAISTAIDRAYDSGIPVILFDRKTDSSKYTAFMGADNYVIGQMLAQYVVDKLGGKGNIVEIEGLEGSSPAIERHEGFKNLIDKYPDLHIVASASGDWTEQSGVKAMQRIMQQYSGRIDCIFGSNDRMAVGAKSVLHASENVLTIGIDALPDGGIQQVNTGVLDASAIYPTHGDELMQLALNILRGEKYPKESIMVSSLVTSDNARILLLQHEELVRQSANLSKMHGRVDRILDQLGMQEILLVTFFIVILIVCFSLAYIIRAYRQKHILHEQLEQQHSELRRQRDELAEQKEIAERQRDELEIERDKLIEARLVIDANPDVDASLKPRQDDLGGDVLTGDEKLYRQESVFIQRFVKVLDERIADCDLSVEDIGTELGFSRVQLYRKVKALTGKSPVEFVRERRLERAQQLLLDSTFNISEIAYKVGFSSPSYFTKCYKDLYGISPTSVRE